MILLPANKKILIFVLFLFVTNILFAFINAIFGYQVWDKYKWIFGNIDRGIPELFLYFQEIFIILVLLVAYVRTAIPSILIIALFFLFVALDDIFQIHEYAGFRLAGLNPFTGLGDVGFGKILFSAVVGFVFLAAMTVAWIFADARSRKLYPAFLVLFFGLAFFAVIVNELHEVVYGYPSAYAVLGFVEDLGEMIVVTLACWVSLGILLHYSNSPQEGS